MPTNLYGLGDTYNLETGHMIPSLIKKFLLASRDNGRVVLWGTGTPRREALFSEDCADALIYLMNNYSSDQIVNVGTGFDYSIKEIAEIIGDELEIDVGVEWDSSKPDGTFEKRTDIQRLKKIYPEYMPRSFKEGLKEILNSPEEVERILRA
jgi:GDP-L-fucose synthase